MRPAWRLEVESEDVTARVREHLVELSVTLSSTTASDALQITLSDALGVLARPAAERVIRVSLGYRDTGLVPCGVFYHSETDIDFAPRRMVLRATAADLRGRSTLKAPRSRAWPATTLGAVVATIAAEHGYTARVAPVLAAEAIGHIDQTSESDLGLLHRLARGYDAAVKAAGGALVVVPRGLGRSVSGSALPTTTVSPGGGMVLSGRIAHRGRPRYAAVQASYYDVAAAAMVHVTAGAGEPRFVIRAPRPDRAQALAAAQARLARLLQQAATLELDVVGDPTLAAEGRIRTTGWGAGTDGVWSITRVRHTLSTSGFRSQVLAAAAP